MIPPTKKLISTLPSKPPCIFRVSDFVRLLYFDKLCVCVFVFICSKNRLPSSSSESIALEEPRFQRKLRNGLFERVRARRPIFNEPPLPGVKGNVEDNGVDRRWSEPNVSRATFHPQVVLSIWRQGW